MRAMLALLPLAVASGCGGGPSEADKAKRYRAQATGICQQLDGEQARFILRVADAEVPGYVNHGLTVIRAATDRLRHVTPPKKLAPLHRNALAAVDMQTRRLERARRSRRPLNLR